MRLKSILLAILACVLLTVVSGCDETKKVRIGVSQCSQDDWRTRMNEEMLRETMLHDDVEVVIRSADDSNEKQAEDIRWFANNGFDIIIAAPNESDPITPVIDEVMARGIPVIVFDRSVSGNNYTAFRGADNYGIGEMAARYMMTHISPEASVIEITGNMGSTPARDRSKGFADGLAKAPGVNIVGSASGMWNYDDAYAVADSLFNLYPDVDVVYAHNDRMAIAAADAAARHGASPYIIGVDGAPEIGLKAVAEDKIDATFIYPTEGHALIRTALDILRGNPYEREVRVPSTSAVDRTNADILILQNESLKEETSKIKMLKSKVDAYWEKHSMQTTFLYVTLSILILLFVFMFLFLRAYWQKQRQQRLLVEQNHELEQQRDRVVRLNKELQEATQSKLMFFTNVSHDLRTPLTLIAEPISRLVGASNLTTQQDSLVRIADRNIRILRRLINQVLDFRKYENGKATLNLTEVELPRILEDWTGAFHAVARQRHIHLSLNFTSRLSSESSQTGEGEQPTAENISHIAIDIDKIERVFFNLLSNAFKHTPDNGSITVSALITDKEFSFSVTDTGCGISAEDLPNIFGRFFQVDKVHPNGSGIGLSLAKAFVELHGGTITAESEPGKGSVFNVTLPVRHVSGPVMSVSSHITDKDVATELSVHTGKELPMTDSTPDPSRPLLLAIDDSSDMLSLLTSLLGDDYNIITASDGAEGIRKAAKYVPDLIICDVMMPVMDGLECCRRIKGEVSTSHIPVLMLTACSMDEQRVSGYESGADGYLAKPFGADVLRSRCASLIANRRLIKAIWQSDTIHSGSATANTESPKSDKIPSSRIDSEFYDRFLEIFREHMGNPEINVDALASEMGLGRSQFYRKIKALTNYSPVELIRMLRLREARHLLLTTERSISEIAYATGFSTPAYFTRCYRDEYAETPTATRQNLTAK